MNQFFTNRKWLEITISIHFTMVGFRVPGISVYPTKDPYIGVDPQNSLSERKVRATNSEGMKLLSVSSDGSMGHSIESWLVDRYPYNGL